MLESLFKNIDKAVVIVNANLKVEYINAAGEKLFKCTNSQLTGKKSEQLFENNQACNEFFAIAKRLPQATDEAIPSIKSRELNILDSNNNKIPVLIYSKKIESNTKSLMGFIFVLTDLSETIKNYQSLDHEVKLKNEDLLKLQKKIEIGKTSVEDKIKKRADDFKEEYTNLLTSINNLSLCFIMTDKYNNIIFSNKTAANMFPFLPQKIIKITELQKCAQMNIDLDAQAEKARNEKRFINIKDAQIDSKFFNIFISPVILESKQNLDVIGTAIIIEDQTKQHNLQQLKEDFFNIATHELRTPLTAIYGYVSLIKHMYFGNIQNEELKSIVSNIGLLSKKLSLIVNNFLDSSKIEQKKIELKNEPCDLFTVINESIEKMTDLATKKNLYIKFDPPASPIIINADRIKITQILDILINNSINFTFNGGIYISIKTESNLAKIIIKDTGIGISDKNKELLFHKFQRAGDSLLTRQEGTGLGLYLAKLLIEKMQGTINLEKTEINKGSVFTFTIPIFNN